MSPPSSTFAPVFSPRNPPLSSQLNLQHCHWCDDLKHTRRDCVDLGKNIREGRVRINENNHVVSAATGQEFPLMIEEGGMRRILEIVEVGSLAIQSQFA